MEKLENVGNKREIYVELCLSLVKHGYRFVQTNDLGEREGFCDECGTSIRYEQIYNDLQTGEVFTIGSSCMFKIYVLDHWGNQINEKDLENKHLQRAGKWLWIIHRDDYLSRIEEEIPQPKDYNKDFKKLADDLKYLVMKERNKIKKEIAEENRIAEEKRKQEEYKEYINKKAQSNQDWLESEGIDYSLLNDWEKNFLKTMQEADFKGWRLSDKQVDIFNRIKTEKSNKSNIKNNQNLASVAIVNNVSEKDDYSELNDWEKEFMESIGRLVDAGYTLTQKQLDTMQKIDDKLSDNEETEEIVSINRINEDCGGYISRKVNSWLINKLCGIWTEGVINFVKNETDSAILCNIFVENNSEKILLEEKWIPKSQLVDDNFSL